MASTVLSDCVARIADAWLEITATFEREHPDRSLLITATYRDPEEQFRLYQVGRRQLADGSWTVDEDPKTAIVTQLDGSRKRSKHNRRPAAALDFCVLVGGKVSWDRREYEPVGAFARAHGLVWGGDWNTIPDCPHLEIPG